MENIFKFRSESEKLNPRRIGNDSSLPRGEYFQNVIGPKLNKSPMQPQPISHKPIDNDDALDNPPIVCRIESELSMTSSDSQANSEENTPTLCTKSQSLFFKQSQLEKQEERPSSATSEGLPQHQRQGEKYYTPVLGKKKVDLYKLSIIQNASKFVEEQTQAAEGSIESKQEETKQSGILRIRNTLTETLKEQTSMHRSKSETLQLVSPTVSTTESLTPKLGLNETPFIMNKLVFGAAIDEKALQRHMMLAMRGLNYSIKLLKSPPLSYIESRQIVLKELKKKNTKTLLLDLDETLITSCSKRDGPDRILMPEGDRTHPIMIKIRPFAREFLKKMKEHFEILVFTASHSIYAETVVRELDPEKKFISYILDRNFCLETKNGFFIKDLRILKNRELKNLIIVDNLVHSFGFQIENGVPILEWTGDKNDQELQHVADYLIEAKNHDDMRDYNRAKLRLVEFSEVKLEVAEDL